MLDANKEFDEDISPTPVASTWWTLWKGFQGTNSRRLTRDDVPYRDLTGAWVIITGSNNGIGREAALFFAGCGANIVLACREPPPHESHPKEVLEECTAIARAANHTRSTVEWWEIDMARLDTVRSFAKRWLATGRPLDILCNNAGCGGNPGTPPDLLKTEDGFELVHQVNFLSHVLLTSKLLPSVEKAAEPRIICTTSCMTYFGSYNLGNWNGAGCQGGQMYQNNKLYYQIWLTELQERLLKSASRRHITVNGVHPGYVKTGIWVGTKKPAKKAVQAGSLMNRLLGIMLKMLTPLFAINAEQGSYAITHAATSVEGGPDPKRQGVGVVGGKGGGRYFNRIWATENMPHCYSAKCRAEVWKKASAELEDEQLANL